MLNIVILEFLNMGGSEIMLIVIAILLLFGGKKLPELARGLGKGIREFKDASDGVKREIQRNINSIGLDDEDDSQQRSQRTYREPEEDQEYSMHESENEAVNDEEKQEEPKKSS